jgi:hypothetical protein
MNYELGQKVTVITKLKRVSKFIQESKESPFKAEYKLWEEQKLRDPINGIIVGVRKLSNGKNHWNGETGNDYEPKEHFKALIIAYHINRKPILVKI